MATAASDDLTKRATSGQLTDAERASAWRVFLGAATDLNYKKPVSYTHLTLPTTPYV